MATFFVILMLVAILLAIVGGINPSIFKNRKTGFVPKRLMVIGSSLGAAFFCFVMIAVFVPEVETENKKSETTKTEENEAEKKETVKVEKKKEVKEYSVIPSCKEFKKRFNSMAKEAGSSLRVGNITIENGEYPTFKHMITANIGFVGTMTSDKKEIKSLMMIGSGDGTKQSGLNIFMAMAGLIASVNPELSADERGILIKEIGLLDGDIDIMNHSSSAKRGNIKYSFNSTSQLGIMFGADNMKNSSNQKN